MGAREAALAVIAELDNRRGFDFCGLDLETLKEIEDSLAEVIDAHTAPTLRDQFAMAALTGIMANPKYDQDADGFKAQEAYDLADTMLVVRERK